MGCFATLQLNAQDTSNRAHDESLNTQDKTYNSDDKSRDVQHEGQNKQYEKNRVELNKSDVPEAVKSAFDAQFSNASDVEWKNKDGNYKVKFNMNGKDHMAELNRTGEVISKGMEVDEQELPSQVSDAIKNKYSSDKIDDAYRVEKDGKTMYMVKLEGNNNRKLVFDEQGTLVKEK